MRLRFRNRPKSNCAAAAARSALWLGGVRLLSGVMPYEYNPQPMAVIRCYVSFCRSIDAVRLLAVLLAVLRFMRGDKRPTLLLYVRRQFVSLVIGHLAAQVPPVILTCNRPPDARRDPVLGL